MILGNHLGLFPCQLLGWKFSVLYQLCWKSLGGKAHHTWSRRGNRRWRDLKAGGSLVAHSPAGRANRQASSGSHSAWNSHHTRVSGMLTLCEVQAFLAWYRWHQCPHTDTTLHKSFNMSACRFRKITHICFFAAHHLFTASWHRYTDVIQVCFDPIGCQGCCSFFNS